MATIQLTRKKEFQAALRDYQVFVDHQKIGSIANHETKEFSIAPGRHQIAVKIDWCSSPVQDITLSEEQTIDITVEGAVHHGWLYKILLCFIFLEFVYMGIIDKDFTGFSLIPLILYYSYYFTLGRNKYLILSVTQ